MQAEPQPVKEETKVEETPASKGITTEEALTVVLPVLMLLPHAFAFIAANLQSSKLTLHELSVLNTFLSFSTLNSLDASQESRLKRAVNEFSKLSVGNNE